MRNLPLPSRDSAENDLRTTIQKYRHKKQLLGHAITSAEVTAVLAIYDRYDEDLGAPCDALKGGAFPASLIHALELAYDRTQKGRKLSALREALFAGVKLCPICGIDPPTELDHFLPRSSFKPLSIYTRNLVPLCHACNHTKLAGFGDLDEDEHRFVHVYFDALPDIQFLRARTEIRDAGLVVEFAVPDQAVLPGGFSDRLNHQMTSLRLNERYETEVNTYISGHAAALHIQYETNGQQAVQNFLRLQARYEIGAFYRNHWRPTLLAALADNNEFTDGGFAEVLHIPEDLLDDFLVD
ncbi:HNH endonuclease [Sinorhizobium medicae]|nr:HNH endonuclease [Sinorhizobium medicae]